MAFRSALFASDSDASSQKKPEPDEDERRALIAAFQMYKAAYGDLKVPSRFIVPAMPPWPHTSLFEATTTTRVIHNALDRTFFQRSQPIISIARNKCSCIYETVL